MRVNYCYLAAALALASCDTPAPTSLTSVAADAASSQSIFTVAKTAGFGKATLPAGFSQMTFQFDVRLRNDGSVAGTFSERYESASGIVDFAGEATCVSFDPILHRAWVGGVVTRNSSTNPAMQSPIHQVGRDVWFRVVDNGDGTMSPDRTTVYGFTGAAGFITSAQYCAGKPWTAGDANTWAVAGDILVRP